MILATLALWICCAALLVLPLVPALREWWSRSDAAALPLAPGAAGPAAVPRSSGDGANLVDANAGATFTLRLEGACQFGRLHARVVEFGVPDPVRSRIPLARRHAVQGLPHQVRLDYESGRSMIAGDLDIAADSLFAGHLVVYRAARIGQRSWIKGSIKARGDLVLEQDCIAEGGLVTAHDLILARGVRAGGPLLAEGCITLGAGCVVGSAARPTTLSAPRIVIETGAVVHGTVWASEQGSYRA